MRTSQLEDKFSLGALILAGGRSTRMGKPKLLLTWANTTILGHLVAQWGKLGAEQIAVVGAIGDLAIHKELDRLGFSAQGRIENPFPERGMFSSVQCGARWQGWKPTLSHWALILGDQPHLRLDTLRTVIELAAAEPGKVVQPTHAGRRRHPVLLPKSIFVELRLSLAGNLKEFLVNYGVAVAECDDPGLDLDLDRPEDYKKALTLLEETYRSASARCLSRSDMGQ